MKNNWQKLRLKEIAKIIKGKNPILHKVSNKDFLPYLSAKYLRGDKDPEYASIADKKSIQVSRDEIIIICDGSNSGETFYNFEGILSSTMGKIIHNESVITSFLNYFLLLAIDDLKNKKTGSAIPHLDIRALSERTIFFPPIIEQERIVAILKVAFYEIEKAKKNTKKNLQNSRELLESYLKNIFSNLRSDYQEKKLGEVCLLITDGKHGDCEPESGSGYYFLSAKDVRNNTLNYEKAREITKKDFEETHKRTDLKPGDVLITNSGTIGRMAIAPMDQKTYKTTFQKSVAVIKPNFSLINNIFLLYLLKSDLDKLVNVSAGTAQKNLLLGDLRNHFIKIPPLSKQKEIVKKLDELSEQMKQLEEIYRQKLADLEELKKSILAKAFAGEL